MRKALNVSFILFVLISSLIIITRCENDYPESVWDPNEKNGPKPVVTEIIPADSAYSGVGQVVIKGENFSTNIVKNVVFFSGNLTTIVSATATELTIKTPKLVGDNWEIKIAVVGSEIYSDPVYYKLLPAVKVVGNLMESLQIGNAIAADKAGNVYVSIYSSKVIKKIAVDGTTTHFADVSFLKANGMKMGPDNTLYACFAAGKPKKIVTISQAGVEATYVNLTGIPGDFDFDEAGNIWITVDKSIYLVRTNKTLELIKTFPVTLKTVRVFEGNLYISAIGDTAESKIWSLPIQGETLGTEEVVLDLNSTEWLQGITVNSFTFSEDGYMYLATDRLVDAMIIYNPLDGSYEIMYPELIGPKLTAITWDDYQNIYAVQELGTYSNVLKILAFKEGAAYYGRK